MLRVFKGFLASAFMLLLPVGCANSPTEGTAPEVTVYLVRHAEKVLDVSNPPLTPDGFQRAGELASVLPESGLTHVHSTDTLRTRQTATPASELFGLDIQLYDPSDLPGFADKIKQMPGVHLVVGHSNTTPQLVEALGGAPGTDINEAAEYDRLYVLEITAAGAVRSDLRRYGARYQPS